MTWGEVTRRDATEARVDCCFLDHVGDAQGNKQTAGAALLAWRG